MNPLALEEQVHTFVNSYFPPEEQQKTGFNIGFSFHELDGLHKELPQVKRMTWILSLLAFALIFTAVMNVCYGRMQANEIISAMGGCVATARRHSLLCLPLQL